MSGDRTVLAELASRVAPISLAETTDQAALQTRIDKKYLLPIGLLGHVLDDLGAGLRALEIDGLRVFGYESVYFDTPRLQFYRDHVQGRRLRHKVRTRRYVDSDLTMLEVKEKGGRGETVKHRTDWSPTELFRLGSGGRMFIDDLLDGEPDAASLRPSLSAATGGRPSCTPTRDYGSPATSISASSHVTRPPRFRRGGCSWRPRRRAPRAWPTTSCTATPSATSPSASTAQGSR